MAAAAAAAAAARRAGPGARGARPAPARRWRLPALLVLLAAGAGAARLYRAGEDAVRVLDSGSVRAALANSSAAWLLQFYSSWCGHCIGYAPTWRALAADVRDWAPVIRVGVLDCAEEQNHEVCRAYDVHFYPTFRYFRAFTKDFTVGENFKGPDRELQTVRHTMVDFLQSHPPAHRPPACPPLEPIRPSDVLALLDSHDRRYVAIVFESNSSYVGREVMLDLTPFENIVVKRALDTDRALLEKLGVSSSPSCYLIAPNGSHGVVHTTKPLRSFFSSYLKSLPAVRKKALSPPEKPREGGAADRGEERRDFDRSRLYTADLESGLHYLLRVELSAHKTLAGAELRTLKAFVTVLAKLFPGRPHVRKLLEALQEWLTTLPLDSVPYHAVLDLIDNKMRISGLSLTNRVTWVACQGSQSELRGYTCALWELFHTLTVAAWAHPEALEGTGLEGDPQAVLQAVRGYVRTFFGCRECGEHFEEMARESLDTVKTPEQAILWLWRKHNVVNSRLAGHPSEDPQFPKAPWPEPDLCPACHEEAQGPEHWDEEQVLVFLQRHYGAGNLLHTHAAEPGSPRPPARAPGPTPRPSHRPPAGLDTPRAVDGAGGRAEEAAVPLLGMGFSSLDMSLCVLLYVASSLFLMLMYFFFRARSRRWKVRLSHPAV
ncbi:sulfhydryl oxidase 2 [Sorex araneus]|uniref:sulfhydryl oxidase 2 n=1 Tax=Sorex araneus TaxID=42254 RepID=UPI002433B1C9|nr:sulfhydryl oxidase 2 [Sorex araneus]